MMLRPWEGCIVAFVLGAVFVPSAIVSILRSNDTFNGRLWDRRASSHVLSRVGVARPRQPQRARA